MTMTNSTSEREQRLKEVQERLAAHRAEVDKYRSLQWAEGDALRYYQAPDDVEFLLSLLTSEATTEPDNQQPVKEEACCISALIESRERAAKRKLEQERK